MNDAAKTGFIHIGDKLKIEDIDDFQPHQVNKKEELGVGKRIKKI